MYDSFYDMCNLVLTPLLVRVSDNFLNIINVYVSPMVFIGYAKIMLLL